MQTIYMRLAASLLPIEERVLDRCGLNARPASANVSTFFEVLSTEMSCIRRRNEVEVIGIGPRNQPDHERR